MAGPLADWENYDADKEAGIKPRFTPTVSREVAQRAEDVRRGVK